MTVNLHSEFFLYQNILLTIFLLVFKNCLIAENTSPISYIERIRFMLFPPLRQILQHTCVDIPIVDKRLIRQPYIRNLGYYLVIK